MTKTDVICPQCRAGFRRIELSSRRGTRGAYHCPICDQSLEAFDGSKEIAYRLTVTPVNAKAHSLRARTSGDDGRRTTDET